MTMVKLDDRLLSVFCKVFGAKYRDQVGPATSMDDIPEWDSTSFLDLVLSIEDEFGVTFTPDESVQMFQLGHIQRLIDATVLDIPHDDVAHACCLLHELHGAPTDQFNVLLLSGSSTREGLLPAPEAESMLQGQSPDQGWKKHGIHEWPHGARRDYEAGGHQVKLNPIVEMGGSAKLIMIDPETGVRKGGSGSRTDGHTAAI